MTVVFNRTRNANDILTGFRMPEEMAYRVDNLCRELDLSRSQLLRRCIESYEPYRRSDPVQPEGQHNWRVIG
jgi:Ribbon-helix-helix protein, copG family